MKFITLVTFSLSAVFAVSAFANHKSEESMTARVSAVGTINVGDSSTAAAATDEGPVDGESVYNTTCGTCHTTGIAGAPKVGDNAQWTARLEQGLETVILHAIEGYTGEAGVMPAKGGNPALSDDAVTAAVQYMVDQSQ